jgi:hypothetical protein
VTGDGREGGGKDREGTGGGTPSVAMKRVRNWLIGKELFECR